ncbi:head-tail connector protein [Methylobacterium sp. JK268]
MDLRRISAPLTRQQKLTVVTLDQVKQQERVLHDEEDAFIVDKIEAAYDYLSGPEGWTNGYCLLAEQFEMYVPEVACRLILPVRPLIEEGLTLDAWDAGSGIYRPVPSNAFALTSSDGCGCIVGLDRSVFRRAFGQPYPRAYRIRFTAGVTDPAAVPSPLKEAIKLLAAHWYQNREASLVERTATQTSRKIDYGVEKLAGRYRFSFDHS